MKMHSLWRPLTATLTIFTLVLATGCGGGGDDGDGGQLSAREEQQVKEWFTELGETAQVMEGTGDLFSMDESGREEMVSQMRRISRLSPPRISNDEANQAFRDLHDGMKQVVDVLIEMVENMPSPDAGPAAMGAAMQQMAGMGQTMQEMEARMTAAMQTIQTIIEVDFADDPEAQAQLRDAVGNIGP